MAFRFKVGYTTDPNKIAPSIEDGKIDEGDLIIVNEEGKGSLRFVLPDKEVLTFAGNLSPEELEKILWVNADI